jgi:chemotaxis signal transduction protein
LISTSIMHDANMSARTTKDVAHGTSATTQTANLENDTRELFAFEAGGRLFALPVEDVAGTAENAAPARLPFAPVAILGVVCLRGRMLTVLDPTTLANGRRSKSQGVLPLVIILHGDEQLALAADQRAENLRVSASEIRPHASREASTPPGAPPAESAILGSFHRKDRDILVLDSRKLFAAAMGKSDRRRRRT